MKKLIAISVMIALVAGAVFADISVSSGLEVRFKIVDAEFGDHSTPDGDPYNGSFPKPTTVGEFGSAQIQVSGSNADNTLSGLFRLRNTDMVRSDMWFHRVFINWKAFDTVRFFAGIDQDGKFATDALEGWAFHQGLDDYVHFQWWDYWRAVFPGNWDGFGAAVSFFPVSGLDINLIVPFGSTGWPQATDGSIKKTSNVEDLFTSGYRLQANYSISDVGRVMFSYKGPYNNNHFQGYTGKYQSLTFLSEDKAIGAFGISFLLTGVDGLQAHVGFATDNIVLEYKEKEDGSEADALPLYFGAAAHYTLGDFGVKLRVGGTINYAYDKDRFYLTGNIMPWYNFGSFSAHLDFGMAFDKDNADADMHSGFWVNPYVKLPLSSGYFQVGMSVRQHITSHGTVSIPLTSVKGPDGKAIKYDNGREQKAPTDDYLRFDFPVVLGMSF